MLWLQTAREEPLSYATLKEYLELALLWEFANPFECPENLPDEIRSRIKSYITGLHGMRRIVKWDEHPPKEILEAHDHVVRLILDGLDKLERSLGQVLWTGRGVKDLFDDVVDNGRVLLVLLPPVELRGDPESIAGTFIHSSFAAWLARRSERGIPRSRRGRQPFLAIFDEVDGYEVRDREELARDARDAGIALAFADYPNTRNPVPSPVGSSMILRIGGTAATIQSGAVTHVYGHHTRMFR
jgi:hypothetical protein